MFLHVDHLENSSALPVQCQDRFLGILILHGKTRDKRHIGGLVRVSQIEVYTVKHGINAWRLFFICAFYPVFSGKMESFFDAKIDDFRHDDFGRFCVILFGKT